MATNPLYNLLNPNMQGILNQFQQFKQMFHGDPKAQVQQLLNSGKVSQAQYDQAVRMATELKKYIRP